MNKHYYWSQILIMSVLFEYKQPEKVVSQGIPTVKKDSIVEIEEAIDPNTLGLEYELETPWILWKQCTEDASKIKSICRFKTIAGLWTIYNIINKSINKITIMRDGIEPVWEVPEHKNGGYSLINCNNVQDNFIKIFELCYLGIMGESLIDNNEYITGLTYINCDKYKQIRIWVKTDKNAIKLIDICSDFQKDLISCGLKNSDFVYVSFNKLITKNMIMVESN